ncbi:MAG: SurA N-terminal domain-containing protein [Holosporales bacterium]|jgi:peptidyl-prolyl cis-trans isomerase D|nr:SurA N-terminal domain-containing protein [Holosporales bacterium]
MLQKIRSKSGSLVIKAILVLIGASFVVMGIGDIVRMMFSTPPVAKVGGTKIRFQDFYSQYQTSLSNSLRRGKEVPKDKREQLAREVLYNLIENTALLNEISSLKIMSSRAAVLESLKTIPIFFTDGVFDPERFSNVLSQFGMRPALFIKDSEARLREQQIFAPTAVGIQLNKTYSKILKDVLESKRDFEVAFIPEDAVKITPPTEQALQAYVAEHPDKYLVPEVRRAEIYIFKHDELTKKIEVSQAEVEEALREMLAAMVTPEKRVISTITCSTEGEAEDVRASLLQHTKNDELKKQYPNTKFEEIGTKEKGEIAEDIRDSIFSLGEGEAFGPFAMKGSKFVIYVVDKIIPAYAPDESDSEAMNKLREDAKLEVQKGKLVAVLENIKNQIDDALSAGESREKIQQELPVSVVEVAFSSNNEKKREEIAELVEKAGISEMAADTFRNIVLDMGEGEDNSVDANGASAAIRLAEIVPAHPSELDSIRETAQKDLMKAKMVKEENIWLQNHFLKATDDPAKWGEAIKKGKCKTKVITIQTSNLFRGGAGNALFSDVDQSRLMLLKTGQVTQFQTVDGRTVVVRAGAIEKDMKAVFDGERTELMEKVLPPIVEIADEAREQLKQSICSGQDVTINEKSLGKITKTEE